MKPVKLIALDAEDLEILGAHLQDAVARTGELTYLPKERRFVGMFNRFAWEEPSKKDAHRRRSALRIERVSKVESSAISRKDPSSVLNLLSIGFEAGEAPAGAIILTFSGGGAIRLHVECIEAAMSDLGAAWSAGAVPDHHLDTDGPDAK